MQKMIKRTSECRIKDCMLGNENCGRGSIRKTLQEIKNGKAEDR